VVIRKRAGAEVTAQTVLFLTESQALRKRAGAEVTAQAMLFLTESQALAEAEAMVGVEAVRTAAKTRAQSLTMMAVITPRMLPKQKAGTQMSEVAIMMMMMMV